MRQAKTSNPRLVHLIAALRKASAKENVSIWKRVAADLSKPARIRSEVNLYKLSDVTEKDETVVVPGKVLGVGTLSHPVTVAAFSFSGSAVRKIEQGKGTALSIEDLLKKNPKASRVRIIG